MIHTRMGDHISREDEFKRAMFAPEVERERQSLSGECANLEYDLRRSESILSIFHEHDPYRMRHGHMMGIRLHLDPYQFAQLQGRGEEFAVHIARQLLEKMSRYHLWGKE